MLRQPFALSLALPLASLRRCSVIAHGSSRRQPLTALPGGDHAELAPVLCELDWPHSELLGITLIRTTTLAQGGTRCDFRFVDPAVDRGANGERHE